jgi:hypothetical protein
VGGGGWYRVWKASQCENMHKNPKWQELLNLHNGGCHPGHIFEEQEGEEQMYRAWVNEQRAPQWQTPRLSNLQWVGIKMA